MHGGVQVMGLDGCRHVDRLGEPAEMAAAAVFLCSARASYVSGTVILVDGALTRGLW